jgi:hypothetical protein
LRKTGPIGGPTWKQHEREKVSQVECAKPRRKRNLVSAPRVLGPNGPSVGEGGGLQWKSGPVRVSWAGSAKSQGKISNGH